MELIVRDKLRPVSFTPAIKLEGAPVDIAPEELKFDYKVFKSDPHEGGRVKSAMGPGLFLVTVPEVNQDDIVEAMKITDTKTGTVWTSENAFAVLSPTLTFKKVEKPPASTGTANTPPAAGAAPR
jgi:hypothetical protein